jgi:hypothetical protein
MHTNIFVCGFIFLINMPIYFGFLNKIQLKYIKNILGSPETSDDIKEATREILLENYQPWLKNTYKSFIRQNAKTMNRIYVRELYQYAIYGLLESLQSYNGSVRLHKYADKFVFGQMYKGMNELSILQPLKFSQIKKGNKSLKPVLVSYKDYWMFDKLKHSRKPTNKDTIVEDVKEIMRCSPIEYRRLFYMRYDYDTLAIIRPIADICEMESFSEETYRVKINSILKYIKERLE